MKPVLRVSKCQNFILSSNSPKVDSRVFKKLAIGDIKSCMARKKA